MRIIETMRQDASTGVRMLRRSSGFTIAAIVTLAVGIGANTAIFSLINAALLERCPILRRTESSNCGSRRLTAVASRCRFRK
jgi:hypothetical protein